MTGGCRCPPRGVGGCGNSHSHCFCGKEMVMHSWHTVSHYGPKGRMGRVLFQSLWEAVRMNCHALHSA